MKLKKTAAYTLTALLLGLTVQTATAEDTGRYYGPVVDIVAKPGTHRSLGSLNLMQPLFQTPDQLFFADLRFVLDDSENREGNLGLGYRRIIDLGGAKVVAGGYGFIDRRQTRLDNYFTQATIGGELLAQEWAVRANIYTPLGTDEYVIADAPDTATLTDTGYVMVNPGTTLEKGLGGFDLELGHQIPFGNDSWVHGAYYKFGTNDGIDLDGVRLRAHTQITDQLRIGAEISYDNIRGANHYAEIRYRIPFGGAGKKQLSHTGIHRRMMEPVIRDIDIVTTAAPAAAAPAKGANGKAEQYIFVDNTAAAGGDGTPGNPFNNLTDALAAAAAKNDDNTIFVREGDGATTNQNGGAALNETNLRFIGAGIDLTTREGVFVESGTGAAHITNTGGDAVAIGADNVEVAGFSIDAPLFDGVYVQNFDAANIHDNSITGAGNNGINAAYTDNKNYAVTITGNTASGNTLRGIIVRSYNGADVTATLTSNTASTNSQSGIQIEGGNTNSTITAALDGNITNGNSRAGFYAVTSGAVDSNITLQNHTADGNGINGIHFLTGGTGTHTIATNNLDAGGNTGTGLLFDMQDSVTATITSDTSTATGNSADGLNVTARSDTNVTATISNHASTGNTQQGVDITADGTTATLALTMGTVSSGTSGGSGMQMLSRNGASLDVTAMGLAIDNNTGIGLFLQANNSANMTVQLDASDITNSTVFGLFLRDQTSGAFNIDLGGGGLGSTGQNRIFNAANFDVYADLNGSNVTAQGNWWGVNTGLAGGELSLVSGGSFDSSAFLSADPRP